MVRRGVTPSLLSFHTLMDGAGASGDVDVAVEVSARRKCRGLAGKVGSSPLQVLREMDEVALFPTRDIMGAAVKAACGAGNVRAPQVLLPKRRAHVLLMLCSPSGYCSCSATCASGVLYRGVMSTTSVCKYWPMYGTASRVEPPALCVIPPLTCVLVAPAWES